MKAEVKQCSKIFVFEIKTRINNCIGKSGISVAEDDLQEDREFMIRFS
jgi:hypothetical protein